jgi:hypothetical protein
LHHFIQRFNPFLFCSSTIGSSSSRRDRSSNSDGREIVDREAAPQHRLSPAEGTRKRSQDGDARVETVEVTKAPYISQYLFL